MGSEQLMQDLSAAVWSGNLQALERALDSGADANSAMLCWGQEGTALMLAAANGQTAVVQALLAAGADVNAVDGVGGTAMQWAARRGHAAVVAALLAAGADPNAAPGSRSAPLVEAARWGHTVTVQALTAAGADVNATDFDGLTALYHAARHGDLEAVQVLIAAGASSQSAMRKATCVRSCSMDAVSVLLPYSNTACLTSGLRRAAYNHHHSIVAVLLREVAARGESAAAAAALAAVLPEMPLNQVSRLLAVAVLDVWAKATAKVDDELGEIAQQQQELAAVACSIQDIVVSLAAAQGS